MLIHRSLRGRLLLAATVTVTLFLGLAGIALDRAFVNSAWSAEKNLLHTRVIAFLAMLDVNDQGAITLPDKLTEARLNNPDSGLYAVILNQHGDSIWRSPSSLGQNFTDLKPLAAGVENFRQSTSSLKSPFYYEFGISWEMNATNSRQFTVAIVHTADDFVQLIVTYRQYLVFWLGTAGFILLLVQTAILHWGLQPLSRVIAELDAVERAEQDHIEGKYPLEIEQLSRRINLYIENERNILNRYRDTLSDLAHSLKTPLAVLHGTVEKGKVKQEVSAQVARMSNIIDYQLKRASSGGAAIHSAVEVATIANKTIDSLHKVYIDQNLVISQQIDPEARFYGDEGDLYELIGNCLDNACKWAISRVNVVVKSLAKPEMIHTGVSIRIDDDGPGIGPQIRQQVLRRGVRADERIHGQGIGLAVVGEIVQRYSGELLINESSYGGASILIKFPCS